MRRNKTLYPNLVATAVLCCVFSVACAQAPLPGVDDGMIVVPICGGLTLLLATGLWYGTKRINKNR